MIWLLAAVLLLAAAAIVAFIAGGGLVAAALSLDAALSRRALRGQHQPAGEPRDTP